MRFLQWQRHHGNTGAKKESFSKTLLLKRAVIGAFLFGCHKWLLRNGLILTNKIFLRFIRSHAKFNSKIELYLFSQQIARITAWFVAIRNKCPVVLASLLWFHKNDRRTLGKVRLSHDYTVINSKSPWVSLSERGDGASEVPSPQSDECVLGWH